MVGKVQDNSENSSYMRRLRLIDKLLQKDMQLLNKRKILDKINICGKFVNS